MWKLCGDKCENVCGNRVEINVAMWQMCGDECVNVKKVWR